MDFGRFLALQIGKKEEQEDGYGIGYRKKGRKGREKGREKEREKGRIGE